MTFTDLLEALQARRPVCVLIGRLTPDEYAQVIGWTRVFA
jgi:hypothetical protein